MTETTPVASSIEDLGPSISCFPSGAQFFINSPTFLVEDIAHALGMKARFGGMLRHYYSVAEHSVIVSLLMEELKLGDPGEGLFHDAHEAYIGDMLTPWKPLVAGWQAFEHDVERALREAFYMPATATYGCQQADHIARHIEAWYLKTDRGEGLVDPHGVRNTALKLIDAGWRTLNLYPPEATAAFMSRYEALRP